MNRWRGLARKALAVTAVLERTAGPWLSLVVRLCLAQAFLMLLLHQIMAGGRNDMVLGFGAWSAVLRGVVASPWGVAVQAIAPLLLALGLAGRLAAVALLVQVAATSGAETDIGLFWIALLARIIVAGPGVFSLDRLLRRGVENSALPGAAAVQHALAQVRMAGGPVYQAALRLWLAAAPIALALAAPAAGTPPQRWFGVPHVPAMTVELPAAWALAVAALLIAGAGTRAVALVLLVLIPLAPLGATDERLYWALLLATLAVHGGGVVSVDRRVAMWLRRMTGQPDRSHLPHVVVVGGGFGGIAAVRGLRGAPCRVTLIDRCNHHLFQPLLYQVATASLSPADIASPVRSLLRDQANARVLLAEVDGVDPAARTLRTSIGPIDYDTLVLATGARHGYFGRGEWERFAPGLKSIEDGTRIRRRLLLAFEAAEAASDSAERQAWLTFVIVGGGPTGVELAGAIAELALHGLADEFRDIDPAKARVLLVQAGPRLLPAFPASLSAAAAAALRRLGVEIVLDRRVEAIGDAGVTISGEEVAARTVLWAAGVMASPAAAWLGVAPDTAGRVKVAADLSVPGWPEVFVVGDTAACLAWGGKPVPGLAPAAKQGGGYVARVVRARLTGRRAPQPFHYRHMGNLATIGRKEAVADFGFIRLHGSLAWWLWGALHVAFLVGGRNRVTVLLNWFWAYLTYRRGTRLITGME